MKTSLLPLQKSLYQRLQGTQYAVYDAVPENTLYPYITLGEDTMNNMSNKTFTAENITHTLHIWSQYKGKKEVKQMMEAVCAALEEPLKVDGFTCYKSRIEFMNVIEEPGTLSYPSGLRHGVIRLRFFIYDLT